MFYPTSNQSYSPRLTSVVLAAGISCKRVGASAFAYCGSLTSVRCFSEELFDIDFETDTSNPLYYAHDLYINNFKLTEAVIPNRVTRLGRYQLVGWSGTKITFGDKLLGVDADAFRFCDNLDAVDYKGTLADWCKIEFVNEFSNPLRVAHKLYIGDEQVTDAVIPDTVTSIGQYQFISWSGTKVTLPARVKSIGSSAFSFCSGLTALNYTGDIADWCEIEFADATANPLFQVRTLHIKGEQATEIEIPATVTEIGMLQFVGWDGTKLTLPAGVTAVGVDAFADCENLQSVYYVGTIADWCNIKFESIASNPLCYAHSLYMNNERVAEIVIPNSVTAIGNYQFFCWDGTSVAVTSGATSIGEAAFGECENLTTVTIGSEVASIADSAFAYCVNLQEINYNATACEDLETGNDVFVGAGQEAEALNVNIGSNVTRIPSYLFDYVYDITSITFAENSLCERIGERAFAGCGVKTLTIPENVKYIGDRAFCDCRALTEINYNATACEDLSGVADIFAVPKSFYKKDVAVKIGDNVTKIPAYLFAANDLFYGNTASPINSITIGSGVKTIGARAFAHSYGLTEINFNATACEDLSVDNGVFAGCGLTGFALIIGSNVTKIPANAFAGSYVNRIAFAGGGICETIGAAAFSKCTLLKEITLPAWVVEVGDSAFENCFRITKIELREVTDIGKKAFSGLIDITHVTLGKTLKTIGEAAFENCYRLVEIKNDSSLTITKGGKDNGYVGYYAINVYSSGKSKLSTDENGYTVYTDGAERILVGYSGTDYSLTLPSKITSIGKYAFYKKNVSSVTIPNSVTSIGESAFRECHSLVTVSVGSNVTYVGSRAFDACDGLSYNRYDDVCYLGNSSNDHVLLIECRNKSVVSCFVKDGCRFLYYRAFYDCESLLAITIPGSVAGIGEEVFGNCRSLTSISIPDSALKQLILKSLNGSATDLTGIVFVRNPDNLSYTVALLGGIYTTEIVIPSQFNNLPVTEIAAEAFKDCTGITSITIPSTIKKIGKNAFADCTGLTEINFYASECEDLDWDNGVFARAGQSGEGITVNIGSNVTRIPENLFRPGGGRPNITSVVFAEGSVCETIGSNAFRECSKLTSIVIPFGVTSIGDRAFNECSRLASIDIPDSVTSIGDMAFLMCGLTDVSIPSSVTSIGSYAFAGCPLKSIELFADLKSIGESAFLYCYYMSDVYYNGSLADWCEIEFATWDSNPVLGGNLYINDELVTEIVIPNTVTSIGNYQFSDWNGTSIVIHDNVTSIGSGAFYYCRSLTDITIPASVTSIGAEAFYYCSSLTDITIPARETSSWGIITKLNQYQINTSAMTASSF